MGDYEKFTWTAHRVKRVDVARYRTLITEFEGGREQRRLKTILPRRWMLEFSKQNMTTEEVKEIREFFESHEGRYKLFIWDYKTDEYNEHGVQIVESNIIVRFDTDEFRRIEDSETVYRFNLPIVEVFV